jgi:hypothetical protein
MHIHLMFMLQFYEFHWHFSHIVLEKLLNSSKEATEGDGMIDIEMILGDDTFTPIVS